MERYRMLRATEYNWGLSGPGDWSTVTWRVYSDGTYIIRTAFNPTWDITEDSFFEKKKKKYKSKSGKMDTKTFSELKSLLETKQWRDPTIEVFACDGTAWEIRYYSSDGELLNSSGKLDYIYGEECLERITSMLPQTDDLYDANAFRSVRKR